MVSRPAVRHDRKASAGVAMVFEVPTLLELHASERMQGGVVYPPG